jgi:hypothetical protein
VAELVKSDCVDQSGSGLCLEDSVDPSGNVVTVTPSFRCTAVVVRFAGSTLVLVSSPFAGAIEV